MKNIFLLLLLVVALGANASTNRVSVYVKIFEDKFGKNYEIHLSLKKSKSDVGTIVKYPLHLLNPKSDKPYPYPLVDTINFDNYKYMEVIRYRDTLNNMRNCHFSNGKKEIQIMENMEYLISCDI